MTSTVSQLKATVDPREVRRTVLKMLHKGGASHLGTSMSMIEMLVAAFSSVDVSKIKDGASDRSRVFVSKGHGAACTYATMHHFGLLSEEQIATYHSDDSVLAGHVSHAVENVEHSTGALGHGLSVAAGCAMGLRSRGYDDSLVFATLGDGEIQEGSIWEALMFIRHHNLTNVIPMLDNNGISSITNTEKVINMHPMTDRFAGFGFKVFDIDGHDVGAIMDAIADIRAGDVPGFIICNTVKGRGVPFAEHDPIWHYRTLNDELLEEALAHLDQEDVQ